jgi:3-oxoacyl-[acyl-carrier-protein] synthase II
VSPHFVPMMMPNAAAGAIAMMLGAHGPGFSVSSACATGSHAIGEAKRMLERGEADVVVAGGTEAAITPLCVAAFKRMGALSREGVSRPFDARRDGFVMGEGAGVLVLEAGDAARARGARILGTMRGYGSTGDAHHLTAPDAEGRGGARAMQVALRDAGLQIEDVDYINAHGTSTQLNDRAETRALKAVFGARAGRVPVSSTKSAIGHLLGAAGAVEAVATVLALRDRVAPPTIGWEQADEGLDLDYVPGTARPLDCHGRPPVALSNSFGFGGHNATLCLEAA